MKTRFIMVRHGFSVANDRKCFAGNSDFELTELGKLQAERCAAAKNKQDFLEYGLTTHGGIKNRCIN